MFLKSMKDKKTKVIDTTRGMVLLPGLEENMRTRKGGEDTIYDPHLCLPTSCHEDGRVEFVISWCNIQIRKKTFGMPKSYLEKYELLDQAYPGWVERCRKQKNFVTARGFPLLGLGLC